MAQEGKAVNLYTYLVTNENGSDEIDVFAKNAHEARQKARAKADEYYGVGSTIQLVQSAGGAGVVQW